MHPHTGQSEVETALRGALQAAARLGAGHRRPGQEQWVSFNYLFNNSNYIFYHN